MAYRMHEVGKRTRVGLTSAGDINIEVWTTHWRNPGAEVEDEIFIPAEEVEELATWLLRNAR